MHCIWEIVRPFVVPILLIAVIVWFLYGRINLKNEEISRVVLGVMLGVILGFCADMIKRGLDDVTEKKQLQNVSILLLKEDAKNIYHKLWIWNRIINSKNTPQEIKDSLPPEFDLKYWSTLKKNMEFLMLGANEPFSEIFKEIWAFEEIDDLIKSAKQGDKTAYMFARAMYDSALEVNAHKKLLLHFMTEKEINNLESIYLKNSKTDTLNKVN